MLKLSAWFKANKLSLNMQKSNYIIFKPRQTRDKFTLNIEMNGLCVILDESLSWKPHISQVESKISKSVGVIRNSSFCTVLLRQLCVLYTVHLSILILNIVF